MNLPVTRERTQASARSRAKRRPPLARLLLLGASTLLALLLAELALRMRPTGFIYAAMRDTIQSRCTRPHAAIQYVNRESFAGTFANREFRTTVRINSRGLRDHEFPYEQPAGRRRVLVLGDSFAFGWGVEAEESLAKVAERHLPGVEVLNGGCSGWGTRQELLWLQEEGIRYAPDVVVLLFSENDPADNERRYRFVDGRLRDAAEPAGALAAFKRGMSRHSALWNLVRQLRYRPPGGPADDRRQWESEEALLAETDRFCRGRGARLLIAYVPEKLPGGYPGRGRGFDPLSAFCARSDIAFLNLQPGLAVARGARQVYYRLDDHWTRAGHESAGDSLAGFLRESGWLTAETPRRRQRSRIVRTSGRKK